MPIPEEFLHIFPALPYLPSSVIDNFLKNKLILSFHNKILDRRRHWLSGFVKINWFASALSPNETTELFESLPFNKSLTEYYYWALIEHQPGRLTKLDSDALAPLVKAYNDYAQLSNIMYYNSKGDTIGLPTYDEDIEYRMDTLQARIKQLRFELCLSKLGEDVKLKEIESICLQYPVLNEIKISLLRTDFHNFKQIISQFFLNRINNIMPNEELIGLGDENKQLTIAFVDSILLQDKSIYNQQSVRYVKSVEAKVLHELNQFNFIGEKAYLRDVGDLFQNFINSLIGQADKIAEAYQFIQYTGFGSQSDFFFVDLYGAIRHQENISEIKQIVYGILKPFQPIIDEYKNIGLYENNELRKVVRVMVPLLIITTIFIAITAMLAPLGIPEIAFVATLIPSLFLGMGLASIYCKLKDGLYQSVREFYYGGQYQLPEFQINQRMKEIFGDNATIVRDYYVQSLQTCQAIEKQCLDRQAKGIITDNEKQLLIKNRKKLHLILKEWLDIHENHTISQESVKKIARKQLEHIIAAKRTDLSHLVCVNKKPEVDGWNKLSQSVIKFEFIPTGTNSFVSKLGFFKQRKELIDREEQLYVPVVALD